MTWIVMIVTAGLGFAAEHYLHRHPKSTEQKTTAAKPRASSKPPIGASGATPLPTLGAVLNASRFEVRPILAQFLPEASAEELESLAEHWGPKVGRNRTSILIWRMLLAR
jgi:hypothetical protein